MNNKEIFFMPLGGGQRVGASCYYLRLGDSNIILDAGIGKENGMIFFPKLLSLTTTKYMVSLNQIDRIFISHAHADHIGYLPQLMREAEQTPVYMTEMTKLLTEYQLYDRNFALQNDKNENIRLATRDILDKITSVSFMKPMDFGNFKAMFLPAGHLPGAMMTLLRFHNKNILYTGDYSINSTVLTGGCYLPERTGNIDILIICALHAKRPAYRNNTSQLFITAKGITDYVQRKQGSVMCCCPQLSKGIELLKAVNLLSNGEVPIYIDKSVMPLAEKLQSMGISIFGERNYLYTHGYSIPKEKHIVISSKNYKDTRYYYKNIDFSLHEDFVDLKEFIKKINPRVCVMIHCSKKQSDSDITVEDVLKAEGMTNTQFIFAEENQMYNL